MKQMNKACLLAGLVVVAMLVGSITQLVVAQDTPDSLLTLNMAGTNSSLLTIGMQGIGDSKLIINTSIVIIELTGVHVYPVSCSFGLLRPSDIRSTGMVFTILNAGNTTLNVTIGVSGDWVGSTNWTHSDDCAPGVDIVGLVAIAEDGNGHTAVIVRKNEPYNYLVTDMMPGESYKFGLQIYAPTQFSDYSRKTNTIFISTEEAT